MTFKPKITTAEIEAPVSVAPHEEGSEPFRATIRTNLTRAEFATLANVDPPPTWGEVKARYAPVVVGWNIDAPPPAQDGPGQFDELPVEVWMWLLGEAYRAIAEAVATTLANLESAYAKPSTPTRLDA